MQTNKKAFNLVPRFFCNNCVDHGGYRPFKEFTVGLLEMAEQHKGTPLAFSVRLSYGTNPDEPCGCTIQLRDTPKIVCKSVPREAKLLLRICELATAELGMDKTALVYRGGSIAGTCEQLRLLFSKALRCKRSEKKRAAILLAQGTSAQRASWTW